MASQDGTGNCQKTSDGALTDPAEDLKTLCSEQEAAIVNNALPADAAELAGRFNMNEEEMQQILDELYHRGIVFDYARDGKDLTGMPATWSSSTTRPSSGMSL